MMAAKTANVTARIQPDIKEQAEAILEKLGIPVSVFIDMAIPSDHYAGWDSFCLGNPGKIFHKRYIIKRRF